MIRLSTLNPNPRNPRTISTEAFDKLCASIKRDPEFMVLRPIVVDGEGMVLGGNMRLRGCIALGMEEVPDNWVVRAANLTEEQRKRFVVVDNIPAGAWEWGRLSSDYDAPELVELGLDLDEISLDDTPGDAAPPPAPEPDPETQCPKCGYAWTP